MNPDSRLFYTLIASLVLWAPAAISMVTGDLDVLKGGLIFVAALLLSWFGSGLVANLIHNYRTTNFQVEEAKRQIERMEARQARYGRRREDALSELTDEDDV